MLQVGTLLGGLIAQGAITVHQVNCTTTAGAAAKASRSGADIRRRLLQSAVDAMAKGTSHSQAQQQLNSAGLGGTFIPCQGMRCQFRV